MAAPAPVRLSRTGSTITADEYHYFRTHKISKDLGLEFFNDGGGYTYRQCTREDLKALCALVIEEQAKFAASDLGKKLLKQVA